MSYLFVYWCLGSEIGIAYDITFGVLIILNCILMYNGGRQRCPYMNC